MNKLLIFFVLCVSVISTANTQAEQEVKMSPREKSKEHAKCVTYFTISKMYIKPFDTEVREDIDLAILNHTRKGQSALGEVGVRERDLKKAFNDIFMLTLNKHLEFIGQNKISWIDMSDRYLEKCTDESFMLD